MPKMTADERADLEARLKADDDDDEDDEVEVGQKDGSYFKGSYRRAKKLGYLTEPAKKDDQGDGKTSGGDKRFVAGRRQA